ncbi:hypothetical protein ACSHWG_00895 [Leucobacter sp. Z1108]|uniref:hypothetical protein n=1 Tax=Leucobacter sp. Z1108 TaxID=3439066 RepID=UPI003F4047A5
MADVNVDKLVHMPVAIMVGKSREMDHFADQVRRRMIATATPRASSGTYVNSIKVKRARGLSGRGRQITDRIIYASDDASVQIEWGTDGRPPQLIVTRTLQSFRR